MTDDAGVVEATTAALRGATWTEAGMPRCLPQRWIRLVPASGEDGITALFCQADDPAYAHVPGGVSYSLDESSSRALYAAVTPVLSAREGSVAPVDVTTNLALLVVTVGRGERRVVLASTAKGDQIPLSPAQAGQVVNALMNAGFFPRAARYHRQLGQWLAAPPPLSKPEPDTLSTPAEGWVTVQVITPQLVRTWHETLGGAVFDHTLSTLLRAEDLGNGRAALETLQR